MGAFASMAQNSYGLKLIGVVSVVFALHFLYQLILSLLKPGKKDLFFLLEMGSLTVLSAIFALGVFNIHSNFTDVVFVAAGTLLAGVYFTTMLNAYNQLRLQDKSFALLILSFYLSIILFIVFMITGTFAPLVSNMAGLAGFVLLAIFIITALVKTDFMVDGENLSAFKWIIRKKDRSGLLVSLLGMMVLYFGLSTAGVLPQLYKDDLPQAYYNLVRDVNAGKEDKTDGVYKHDQFKKEYDKFISRNISGQ
jgi:hypothetical protein